MPSFLSAYLSIKGSIVNTFETAGRRQCLQKVNICLTLLLTLFIIHIPFYSDAQNVVPGDSAEQAEIRIKRGVTNDTAYANIATGEFTPGRGFDLVRTKFGTLNISIYAMVRYLNQLPGHQTWYDHLGRPRDFTGRNDFNWHRAMIWFSGWIGTPKFRYVATAWTVMTTQQTLVYGNLQYWANKHFKFGMGIAPNLSIRSMQGPFPFYHSTDRTMGEEALRGGFTNGFFVTGEIVPKLYYTAMIGNNLSTLGVQAAKLTRENSKSISIWWMPTTGEYGPRGGMIDLEYHQKVATRFGTSIVHSREDRFNNVGQPSPDNTQVRMTDGVLFFETDALANGVTVQNADYDMIAVDLGAKYKGFNIQTEWYARRLSKINADGEIPIKELKDYGYSLQASFMAIPQKLNVYAINSFFWDEFKRHPWEAGGGFNFYPLKNRSWRLNVQVDYVYKSAAGGTFGLYTAGQTGTTITVGADILL